MASGEHALVRTSTSIVCKLRPSLSHFTPSTYPLHTHFTRRFRGLPPSASQDARKNALEEARSKLDSLAELVGPNHMLVKGALRSFVGQSALKQAAMK